MLAQAASSLTFAGVVARLWLDLLCLLYQRFFQSICYRYNYIHTDLTDRRTDGQTYVYLAIYTYKYKYVYICIYVYNYMYMYMYVCIYIYLCM